jgi:hypothetical protein
VRERQSMSDNNGFWSDENREIDDLARNLDGDSVTDDVDDEVIGPDADNRSIELDFDPDAYVELGFDNDDRY